MQFDLSTITSAILGELFLSTSLPIVAAIDAVRIDPETAICAGTFRMRQSARDLHFSGGARFAWRIPPTLAGDQLASPASFRTREDAVRKSEHT